MMQVQSLAIVVAAGRSAELDKPFDLQVMDRQINGG